MARLPKTLHRTAIRLLSIFGDWDGRIKHHWTGDKLKLNIFRHRGYWWKGRRREHETVRAIYRLVKEGDSVIELGGHIGYLSQIFAKLAGPNGRLHVFEPSKSNLSYLIPNLLPFANSKIVEQAVSDHVGEVVFYEEGLTGQNNSIVQDYDVFEQNRDFSGLKVEIHETRVQCNTLDAYCSSQKIKPNFIKIDIEGAEYLALSGGQAVLRDCRPVLMVEISHQVKECFELLDRLNYAIFRPDGSAVTADARDIVFNIFALPRERGTALTQALTPSERHS